MSIYSVVKDPRRGKRQGRDESRAQESGARVYGSTAGVSPQAGSPGEARVPKSIIQEGKKGMWSLAIIFMKIQAVTDFAERYDAEKRAGLPGITAEIKTGEMRVKAESRLIPAETYKHN